MEKREPGRERLTSKKMALQMFCMQIIFGAMRTRKFSVGVLNRNQRILGGARASGWGSWTARGAGEYASTALRAHHMRGLIALLENWVRLHDRAWAIGRGYPRLRHAARGHGTQNRRATAANRSRGKRLRVRGSRGGLRHHCGRRAIGLVWRVRVLNHRIDTWPGSWLGRILVARKIVCRIRRVGGSRSSRSVRMTPIEWLHGRGGWLQRRQRLRQRRARLKLMRGNSCG